MLRYCILQARQNFVRCPDFAGHVSKVYADAKCQCDMTTGTIKAAEGFDISAFIPTEGLVLPVYVRLESGARHGLVFQMKNINYFSQTVTLDTLVKQATPLRSGSRRTNLMLISLNYPTHGSGC